MVLMVPFLEPEYTIKSGALELGLLSVCVAVACALLAFLCHHRTCIQMDSTNTCMEVNQPWT
jgi:hypothetical protein